MLMVTSVASSWWPEPAHWVLSGSRVGPPWPLGWALPSDALEGEALEAVRIDFNDGIFALLLRALGYPDPGRHVCPPSSQVQRACVQHANEGGGPRVDLSGTLLYPNSASVRPASPPEAEWGFRQVLSAPAGTILLWTAEPLGWGDLSRAGRSPRC